MPANPPPEPINPHWKAFWEHVRRAAEKLDKKDDTQKDARCANTERLD